MYTVYGFDENVRRCPACVSAKRLLDANNISYQFISVTADEVNLDKEVTAELYSRLNLAEGARLTMPQIFNDGGEYVGGFDQLRQYLMETK